MRLAVLFCIFLHLVGVIQAAPTTPTNTTNTTINDSLEVPSFTTRSLWTIVSSSILTLFACIYSAIHPNIPSPKDSRNRIHRRRLGIMIMALIAPELMVTWAMRQWLSARLITRLFKESGYPNVRPVREQSEETAPVEAPEQRENRLLLTVLANGVLSVPVFLWHFPGALARWVKRSVKAYFSEKSRDHTWTHSHSFFVLMGGFMLYVNGEPYLTLNHYHILKLIREECIDVPTLTEKQIHDKSKGNAISKGLVMLQVAWFVMQLITRAIYHLETTQLEVGTLAFAVLNFLTYAAWWNKPLDVRCPHPVHWKSTKSRPKDHIRVPESDQVSQWGILSPVFDSITELLSWTYHSRKLRVSTFGGNILGDSDTIDAMVVFFSGMLMATIFGGIHCMAWFFAFPTYQEQVLWRMSAVAITGIPWLLVPITCFLIILNVPSAVGKALCVMSYIAARAILLVLTFTTLRNLPSDTYKVVSWTSYVPHL